MQLKPQKIAVVCADLPDRNTGMVTVDLAAHTIVARMFPQAQVTLYSLGRGGKSPYAAGETAHGYLDIVAHADEFLDADVLLYWGDFIHSCAYWELDMKTWNTQMMTLAPAAREALVRTQEEHRSRLIFLSSQSARQLRKVIVFGSTIITNEAGDLKFPAYHTDFERFFSGISAVHFRDALSAAKISPLRGDEATLACDCALLLDDADLNQLSGFRPAPRRKGLGVFFGRSPNKLQMLLFSRLLGSALGQPCHWLPWFASNTKMRLAARLLGYRVPQEDVSPGAILSALSGCEFVVTDTYHVCVNAWRLGIPAACIGAGAHIAHSSVGDKKKEILYEMYGARRLYVFLESLRGWRGKRREAQRVAEVLRDAAYGAAVTQNIQAHRRTALQRLQAAVNKVLAPAAAA